MAEDFQPPADASAHGADDQDAEQTAPVGDDQPADRLSLESLSNAFAKMLRPAGQAAEADDEVADDEAEGPHEAGETEPPNPPEASDAEPSSRQGGDISPKTLLEAMLFVGQPDRSPLTTKVMAALMRGVELAELDTLVRELNEQYRANRCPYYIAGEGAGYRLTLRDEYGRVREKFYGRVREARLSQAAVEVLSIVAYKGPLTTDDVNRMRSRPSGPILAQLVRRQLLEYRRNDSKRNSATYVTSSRFLKVFGLESLDDLPRSQDLDTN